MIQKFCWLSSNLYSTQISIIFVHLFSKIFYTNFDYSLFLKYNITLLEMGLKLIGFAPLRPPDLCLLIGFWLHVSFHLSTLLSSPQEEKPHLHAFSHLDLLCSPQEPCKTMVSSCSSLMWRMTRGCQFCQSRSPPMCPPLCVPFISIWLPDRFYFLSDMNFYTEV